MLTVNNLLSHSMNPTTLTLWDQFTQHEAVRMPELTGLFPVVMGVRLKINASYGNNEIQCITLAQFYKYKIWEVCINLQSVLIYRYYP